jgi:hypothetical protein
MKMRLHDDWNAATLYLWLNEEFSAKGDLFIVHRWKSSCPTIAPSFDQVQATYYVQQRPEYKFTVPLEVRNFKCDSKGQSYEYSLCPSREPKVLMRSGEWARDLPD